MSKIIFGPGWYIKRRGSIDKQNSKIPGKYYFGKEFAEDKERIKIRITCLFPISTEITGFKFSTDKFEGVVYQQDSDLYLEIERLVSKKFCDAIFSSKECNVFLLNYIFQALFTFNDAIINQRYLHGNILLRTCSIYDLKRIDVFDYQSSMRVTLKLPKPLMRFPPIIPLSARCDNRYIRDFIDSMSCYLNWNNDECIRKIISSLENYFSEYKISKNDKFPFYSRICTWILYTLANIMNFQIHLNTNSFNDKLKECLKSDYYLLNWSNYFSIWLSNIKFIYLLRNKIVHQHLRLKPEDRWICKIGIETLSYIYQSQIIERETVTYINALTMQFKVITNEIEMANLDVLSVIFADNKNNNSINPTPEEWDEKIFKGIEIKKADQKKIRKKYNI